jgi:folate-binding protein YgfZ
MTVLLKTEGAVRLTDWGVIRAIGPDAGAFLQGQLTQDALGIALGQARLAAWCNPKGRMLASGWLFRCAENEWLFVLSSDVLATTLKRLSMFVLRAKVKLSDASEQFAVYGLLKAADALAAELQNQNHGLVIRLPNADDMARALLLLPTDGDAPQAPVLSETVWQWAAVRSGVALITQPIAGAFVPQMLNYESVGGVNFKKGCYPGQEVVARSQFRGAIKRRTWVGQVTVTTDTTVSAGMDVFLSSDDSGPVGVILQAAGLPQQTNVVAVIVCLPIAAVESAKSGVERFTLGTPSGPALVDLHQPYPLLENI